MSTIDPYFDESIHTLRNLLGATSAQEFEKLEAQVVFANEIELSAVNIKRTYDLNELRTIHKQLFWNVYDWAGEIRTVDIRKPDEGSSFFLPVSKIHEAANYVFSELKNDGYLANLSIDDFIDKLAYYYDQLNYIHPFREGNGRSQRIFWSRVANAVGYDIIWSDIVDNENNIASKIAAETMDRSALVSMFSKIVIPKQ